MLQPTTYRAPSAWAPYLINGDASGLDEEDKARADAFVDRVVTTIGHANFCDASDAGFCRVHDAWRECPLMADCQDYTLLVET